MATTIEETKKKIRRPAKYTPEVIAKLIQLLITYKDTTEIPILKEFCYKNHVLYETLNELSHKNIELSDTIKETLDKKEVQLERLALEGKIDKTMAIFSLKQLGWKDRLDVISKSESTTNININNYGIKPDDYDDLADKILKERNSISISQS